MIMTDGVHVTSNESLAELHEWAQKNGLKRHWFHGHRNSFHPHYDLPVAKRNPEAVALMSGVKVVTSREIVEASREIWLREHTNTQGR